MSPVNSQFNDRLIGGGGVVVGGIHQMFHARRQRCVMLLLSDVFIRLVIKSVLTKIP